MEFGAREAAFAVEEAQKVGCGALALATVAVQTAGDEVAVGAGAVPGARHDVIQALHFWSHAAETIKADAAFASVDGAPKGGRAHKVEIFEVGGVGGRRSGQCGVGTRGRHGNVARQADVDDMPGSTAMDKTHGATGDKAPQRDTDGFFAERQIASEPALGEVQARLPFEAAMAEQMIIDGAVGDTEAQARREIILELLADEFGIGLFGFHDFSP